MLAHNHLNVKHIPISYFNQTRSVDFEVMVYAKNHDPTDPLHYQVAWQVLRGQGGVDFDYPLQVQIGAHYDTKNQSIECGPLDADPGTTWEIIHEFQQETPFIQQGNSYRV